MINLKTYNMAVIDSRPAHITQLQAYFQQSSTFDSIIAVGSVDEFYDHLGRQEFDIVLCGLTPALETVQAMCSDLQSRPTPTKLVLLSPLDDKKRIFQGLCFGATAFLPDGLPLPIMEQRLVAHLSGEYWLNPELGRLLSTYFDRQSACTSGILHPLSEVERALLQLVSEGACPQKLAEELELESATITSLMRGIYYKLQVIHRKERALPLTTMP